MGQAKIKRNRQLAEAKKRKAEKPPIQPDIPTASNEPRQRDVFIDHSGVGQIEQVDKHFVSVLNDMSAAFRSPAFVYGVAVHESGHAIRFDLQNSKGLRLRGPRILHNPQSRENPFPAFGASVEEIEEGVGIPNNATGVFMMAQRFVAGGVASQAILSTQGQVLKDEIEHDWSEFLKMCNNAEAANVVKGINKQVLWNQAWDATHSELANNPSVKAAIIKTADMIKNQLYQWRGEPMPIKCLWPSPKQ